jgi:hypothetical protein
LYNCLYSRNKHSMRSLLIISVIIVNTYGSTFGQPETIPANGGYVHHIPFIYGEAGISYGTHLTGNFGINEIFTNDNILSFYFSASTHNAPDVPSDFRPGLLEAIPHQALYTVGFCYGKVFYTNTPSIRYVLKGGVCAGYARTPTDFVPESGWFNSNYSYTNNYQPVAGILLNPAIELPMNRNFGFTAGGYANINTISSVFGLECSVIFGRLRHGKMRTTH